MAYLHVIWDTDDDSEGNAAHVAEHGLTKAEVEEVLRSPAGTRTSRSSGRPISFGYTTTGRLIAVVYEEIDADTVYPVTAYNVE